MQNHGEVFLRKNVGIGRNLSKARAYQKSHETFEGVVQVGHILTFFVDLMSHFSLIFWTNNNFLKREFPKTLHRLTDLREKISTLSFKMIKERAQKRTY